MAVKVAVLPKQTGFDDTEIETPAGKLWVTTMLMGLEVAGLPEAQVRSDIN